MVISDGSDVRRHIRVLVVDDSVDHRTLMMQRLRHAGMQVSGAATAQDAMAQLEDVDLVLLDYRLPGVDGLEVLRAIRSRAGAPSVIMVTGAGSTEVAVEAMRDGAINYVAKERGYTDTLPEVVERAWRTHDLQIRAEELQRLTLLVTSTTDRRQLSDDIVAGAARLLHADSCALLVADGKRLERAALLGAQTTGLDELTRLAERRMLEDAGCWMHGGWVVVPLPSKGGEPLGCLVLWTGGGGYTEEELQLARVFASFAGIALGNLHQFELERRLATELQQSLDARRDFVASVSHELRTPLTSIAGFTTTLRSRWADIDEGRRLDLLDRVARNAEDMARLVDELLELAAIERGRAIARDSRPLPLPEAVQDAISRLGDILHEHEVRVDLPGVQVVADATLVGRTLSNLLTNAAKFSPAGTRIDVRARTDRDLVHVEVADQGIGLDEWEAARVFDPFFRARSSVAQAVRGSGIGLALVREYVRAMGGEVTLHSVPGQGSTFGFTLPMRAAAAAPEAAAKRPAEAR